MPAMQRTFLMIKPDGVQRGLVGDVITRFEKKGWKMLAAKFLMANDSLLEEHYAEHRGRPFLPGLVKYMSSGPVLAMVWEGPEIVSQSRRLIGATRPWDAEVGTIRGDLCVDVGRNLIHGSDGVEAAEREINLWFKAEEIVAWQPCDKSWLVE